MKKKKYHHKLIRDKIPSFIGKRGKDWETRTLDEKEFGKELKKKLVEEAKELNKASKKNILNELADVLELLKSIAFYYKIGFQEVEKYQIKKKKERGSFKKRLFLLWSRGETE